LPIKRHVKSHTMPEHATIARIAAGEQNAAQTLPRATVDA
jgi:hypothetical protein